MSEVKSITIAIDGPSGSGKSTTARRVARELGYLYVDTGAMYRAVTLAVIENELALSAGEIDRLLESIDIQLTTQNGNQRTFLNSRDVTDVIRTPNVTARVSEVSAIAKVRERMVELQQQLGENGGIVMDGRDIGTTVFPNAELKIFLVANISERAKRRSGQLKRSGIISTEVEIAHDLERRDAFDSGREVSPLKKSTDAIEIDTSNISPEEQVQMVVALAREKMRIA